MAIVRELAGYSYGRADLVRRAMAKKKKEKMEKEREIFINGKLNEGPALSTFPAVSETACPEKQQKLCGSRWHRSHPMRSIRATLLLMPLCLIRPAFLRLLLPREFMAALMSNAASEGNTKNLLKYISDCDTAASGF